MKISNSSASSSSSSIDVRSSAGLGLGRSRGRPIGRGRRGEGGRERWAAMSILWEKSEAWRWLVRRTRDSKPFFVAFATLCGVVPGVIGYCVMQMTSSRNEHLEAHLRRNSRPETTVCCSSPPPPPLPGSSSLFLSLSISLSPLPSSSGFLAVFCRPVLDDGLIASWNNFSSISANFWVMWDQLLLLSGGREPT